MATLELDIDVTADFDEEGVEFTLYLGDDDEGKPINFTFETLVDQLFEEIDKDDKHDRRYAEKVAQALAEASKDILCNLT